MAHSIKLLNRDDAAGHVGISPRTFYALVRRGEIPAVRVGRVLKFNVAHLDEWLASRTANAPEAEPALLRAPIPDLGGLARRSYEAQLLGALLVEQRGTNFLLTRLLNRR